MPVSSLTQKLLSYPSGFIDIHGCEKRRHQWLKQRLEPSFFFFHSERLRPHAVTNHMQQITGMIPTKFNHKSHFLDVKWKELNFGADLSFQQGHQAIRSFSILFLMVLSLPLLCVQCFRLEFSHVSSELLHILFPSIFHEKVFATFLISFHFFYLQWRLGAVIVY